MEIENHKEEVPFGHYQELFQAAEATEMAMKMPAETIARQNKHKKETTT